MSTNTRWRRGAAILATAALGAAGAPSAHAAVGHDRTTRAVHMPVGRTGPLDAREQSRQHELAKLVDHYRGNASRLDRVALKHGFQRVSTRGQTTAARTTSGNDISFVTPSVYYDLTYHRYTATATYSWTGQGWEVQTGLAEKNVGGVDGFALRFDTKMDNQSVTGAFFGRPVRTAYFGVMLANPSDNSKKGVEFLAQDKIRAINVNGASQMDMNMYRGSITVDVGRPACGTTVKLYSSYAHTWSESEGWSAASQAGRWYVSC